MFFASSKRHGKHVRVGTSDAQEMGQKDGENGPGLCKTMVLFVDMQRFVRHGSNFGVVGQAMRLGRGGRGGGGVYRKIYLVARGGKWVNAEERAL